MKKSKLKRPKAPTKPVKPYKPVEPSKQIQFHTPLNFIEIDTYSGYSLEGLTKLFTNGNASNTAAENIRIEFSAEGGDDEYGGGYTIGARIYSFSPIDNPRYDELHGIYLKEMVAYEKAMIRYTKKNKGYKTNLVKYEAELDAYNLAVKKEEIQRLEDKLKTLKEKEEQ